MRKILILACLMFLCGSINAQINKYKYYPTVIVLHNGTQVEGFAKFPSSPHSKTIKFKTDKAYKKQKMKSEEIKTIRFFLKGDKTLEFEYLSYISSHSMEKGTQKLSDPIWMEVLIRGSMTLYSEEVTRKSPHKRTIVYHYYYAKRENENVATEIADTHFGYEFHKYAYTYFTDNPSISEKIKNKEKGYSAENIRAIIEEYNAGK